MTHGPYLQVLVDLVSSGPSGSICHCNGVGSKATKPLTGQVSEHDNPLCVCSATSPATNPKPHNPTGATRTQTHITLMYTHAHIHTHLLTLYYGHTLFHTQVNIHLLMPEYMHGPNMQLPLCPLSKSSSQSLMCHTCMQQCSCACFNQACHVHICMCYVLQHAYIHIDSFA